MAAALNGDGAVAVDAAFAEALRLFVAIST